MGIHVDFSVREDCLNPEDSYGEICVHCNCCGRFNPSTKYESRIKTYERQLQEDYQFKSWSEDESIRRTQEENHKSNIQYMKRKIRQAQKDYAKHEQPKE